MTREEWEVQYFELMAEKKKLLELISHICNCDGVSDGLREYIRAETVRITGNM